MSLLDEIENPNPSANEGGVAVEAESLEVAGVKLEADGTTTQVPGNNTEDYDDLYAGEPYKIPEHLTKEWFYQLIPLTRLAEYQRRKFIPVKLTELGIPEELLKTGSPLDGYHVVGNDIMVKCPLAVKQRIDARKAREVKDRLQAMEPTADMVNKAHNTGVVTQIKRSQAITRADPSRRAGIGLEDGK